MWQHTSLKKKEKQRGWETYTRFMQQSKINCQCLYTYQNATWVLKIWVPLRQDLFETENTDNPQQKTLVENYLLSLVVFSWWGERGKKQTNFRNWSLWYQNKAAMKVWLTTILWKTTITRKKISVYTASSSPAGPMMKEKTCQNNIAVLVLQRW